MGRHGWWRTGSSAPRYRTYTYTARSYKRLIAEAGYHACQVFVSVPSYNWPHAMVPVQSQRLIGFYASHLAMSSSPHQRLVTVVEEVLAVLRLQGVLGRSFSILARR
jgi:hypothetical protein